MLGKTIGDLQPGDVFQPVTYVLTPMMAAEYAAATDETSEWFQSAHNPEGRQVRPPTMIHTDKMRLLEANCTFERRLANVIAKDARIHYEYNAKHHSIGYVGETFVVTGEIIERYKRRGREYIRYRMEVKTADGRLVTSYTDRTLLRYRPEPQQENGHA